MKPGHGRMDRVLLLAVFMIVILGLAFVYSATYVRGAQTGSLNPLVARQCLWVGAGFAILLCVAGMDYIRMLDFAYIAYGINLLLLVFLLLFGGERYGAKRWIDLGFFSLQPSEFVKITVIFALAAFLGERKEKAGTLRNYVYALLLVSPAFLLIFLQPDLGTALVLVPILFSVLYVSGENIKYIVTTMVFGVLSMPVFWNILKDYQKSRLLVFMNPNIDPLGAGYTIIQSKIAIGSGGVWGKGWLGGTQSHLRFLPERHTDFIFSVIGEEWGFVGAMMLLGLYCLIIARGVRIISGVDDTYGKAIATGLVTLIAVQVLTNIAMTVGLMPVVGLPLPFISYGGSNIMATMIGIGFLLSVSRRRKR